MAHTLFSVLNSDEKSSVAKLDKPSNGCGQVEGERTTDLADVASQGLDLSLIHVGSPNLRRSIEEVRGKSQTLDPALRVPFRCVIQVKLFHTLS